MKSKTGLKLLLRAAMCAFIAVPVALAALAGFVSVSAFSSKFTSDNAGGAALSQISGVSAIVGEYANTLASVAALESVKQTAGKNYAYSKEAAAYISVYAENGYNVLDIIITDADGNVNAGVTDIKTGDKFFDTANLSADGGVSDIFPNKSEYDNKNVFYCSKAVYDGEAVAGYVVLVADVKGIADYLAGTNVMNGKGSLVIFDADGNTVNAGGKEAARLGELSGVVRGRVDNYKNKQLSMGAGESYEKFETGGNFGGCGYIAGTKWKWLSLYPASAASSLTLSVFLFSSAAAAAVCLVNVVVMIASTRSLTRPLRKMIDKMRIIKDGDLTERFETTGRSEFVRMAETFNVMLDEVMLSEGLHRTISEISDNMLFEWDFTKEIMYISENFKNTFDITASGAKLLNGKFLDSQMDDENTEKYRRDINRLLQKKDSIGSEYEIMTKNGKNLWISLRAHCVTDRLGELVRVLGVITNIDNEKKLNLQLAEKASYDFLSGLYNRSTFERELDAELGRSANKKLAILFIDIDDFKFINDRFNHTIGDEAIKFVSEKLKKRVEESGFAGRFGGDEFVLCIRNQDMIEDIEQTSMDIIDELYDGYYSDMAGTQMNVRVSIGIALCPDHSSNGKTLVAQADEAMYFVKKNGKSNYHYFDPEDSNIIDMMHHV
ncbi:MAG: diguanylate cyclase [Oscillospiraceae bacterium]|jgi:diguanylate cyclase (GGDEF)-like protein/PAS domain S-box-containing protein|nr:diguanylate cyclase [Oscillospiraceae bacterium]